MKRLAKQSALQELAKMIMPSLMEDLSPAQVKEMKESMPEEVEEQVEEKSPVKDVVREKPKVAGLSMTRLVSEMRPMQNPAPKPKRKRRK